MKTQTWKTIIGLGTALLAIAAHAETTAIWTGLGGDVFWNTQGNWDGGNVPAGASDLTVRLTGNTNMGLVNTPLIQDIADPLDLNRLEAEDAPNPEAQFHLSGFGLNFVADGDAQPFMSFGRDANTFITAPINIPADTTLTVSNRTYVVNLNGVVSGDGALCYISGSAGGEISLNNADNTYAGGTFYLCSINTGRSYSRLRVTASGALGSGPVTLQGGNLATAATAEPGGITFQNHTTHANAFTLLSDVPIFAGEGKTNATVTAATVTLTGDIDLADHALYLRGQGNTAGTLTGTLTGDGPRAIVKLDRGDWTLAGANAFTGSITLASGTLTIADLATLDPAVPLVINGGTLNLSGRTVPVGSVTINGGTISNGTLATASGLTKTDPTTVTLTDANPYAGPTLINAGTLQFAKRAALYGGDTAQWTPANITVNNGATLALNVGGDGEFTATDLDTLNTLGALDGGFRDGSFLGIDTTFAPDGLFACGTAITDPAGHARGLTKLGEGTLELGDLNTNTGPTSINEGILSVTKLDNGGLPSGIGASLSNATSLVFNGGPLRYTGPSATIDRLFTYGTGNTATFDVTQPGTTLTFTQVRNCANRIAGVTVIAKRGPGTLVFGNDGPGGTSGYIGDIGAYEIHEGTYATVSGDVAQLNTTRIATNGPALLLGDGARMEYDPPLSAHGYQDEQTVRYTGTTRGAFTAIGAIQGPETSQGEDRVLDRWNTKAFDINDGADDIDLTVTTSLSTWANTGLTPWSRIRKDGPGTLLFTGNSSNYRDTTIIRAGRLLIRASVPTVGNSPLGNCPDAVIIGDEGTQPGDTPALLFDAPADSALTFERGLVTWTETGTSTFGSHSNLSITLSGPVTVSNTLRLASAATGANALIVTGGITGPGGVAASGVGTVLFSSVNTYTGATTVESGMLRLGVAGSIADASSLRLSGGTLDLNGFSETVGALDVDGAAEIVFNGGALTCAAAAGNWDGTLILRDWQRGATPFFIGIAVTLTDAQLAKITSPSGQKAAQLPTGEIILIPPGTVLTIQ